MRKFALKKLNKLKMGSITSNDRLSSSNLNFEEIRQTLLKHKGGAVRLETDPKTGIATIAIEHTEKRNAISGTMMVMFRDCIEQLEKWQSGKGVIIYGKGANFCSGGDLSFAREHASHDSGYLMSAWMQDTLNRFQKLPMITVCVAKGPTLGGGAEISVSCDFIVVGEDVKYGFVHGKLGIVPAWGGGIKLIKKVGSTKALDLLLTSRIINAQECLEMGLAEIVVQTENALESATEWLQARIKHDVTVVREMKKLMLNSYFYDYKTALEQEMLSSASLWGGLANQNALNGNLKHL